ncbi:two-partner secretion domain-containing protein [Pseudomonas sp. CFBP 5748]
MDDRQYAFLARQPSAALQTRNAFWGMPKRGLAFLLANVMFWQPLWAQADGIVVSAPGTSLGKAGNGVPVVNIAKPNGSGLSHNQFKDYNVGSNGVILNNATNPAQATQLGGIILGNPNLKGTAARVILNEVNGGNPSQLRGYTEVAGQSAHVIVANPYGITCNGCGFINTPKATLTTGKPIIENGQVNRYQVDQGSVTIEGAGLNANNVDRFEIITRSAKINAEIQAKNLTIVAGRNDVNAGTLNATARADDGSAKPELAIDSSALGGMYAGAIKLVGTEAGVGVKLDGKMVASGGDIQLDANGHLSMAETAAAGAVNIQANSLETRGQVYAGSRLDVKTQGDLTSQNNLVARDSVHLDSGGTLSNNGIIEAGVNADNSRNTTGDVTLSAKQLNNAGKTVIASRDLNVTTSAELNNQGGTLSGQGKTTVTGNAVDNRNKGRILGGTELHLAANQVLNSQGGLINSQGLLTGNLGHLENNAGELSSLNSATLILGSLDNLTGLVMAGKNLDITNTGAIKNQGGELSSQGVMTVRTASLDNSNKGTVAANGKLLVSATGAVNNADKGLIASRTGEVEFDAASLNNAKGTLQGKGLVTVDVAGDIDNQGGSIIAQDANLSVFATNLDNRGGVLSSVKAALEARTTGVLKNGYDVNRQGGTIQAQGLNIQALAGLFNDGGRLAAQAGDIVISNAGADINNRSGGMYATGKVQVIGRDMDNSGGGQISASRIDFDLSGALNNNAGIIESQDSLDILAASLSNQKGQLRTLGKNSTTAFNIGGLFDNSDGTLETASNDVGFDTGSVQNVGGKLLHTGLGLFGISQANLGQAGGQLVTYGNLTVTADRWTNNTAIQAGHLVVNVDQLTQTATGQLLSTDSMLGRGSNWRVDGLIGSDGATDLQLTGAYTGNGRLSSLGTLGLKAALINLEQNGSIAGGGNTTVVVDGVLNSYGRLTSAADLSVTAATINNYGTLGSAGALGVSTGDLLNEHGLIFSGGNTSLRINSLTNRYADIYSLGDLSIDRDGLGTRASRILNSSGTLQSDGNMRLAASTIDNVREVLATHDAGIYTASIREVACIEGVNAGDCSGGKENHVWQIVQRDKFEVTAASAASSITTGGNLNIQGDTLTNRSSSIGVGGALTANLVSLNNIGIETGEIETSRTFRSQRTRRPGSWRADANNFTNKYWLQSPGYNANDLSGLEAAMSHFIGRTERELTQFRTQTTTTDSQTYAAIIQAGGTVDIPTQGDLNSGVVRGGYNYVGAGPRTDTQADNAFSTRISVNRQLPPSLTQQQVDPLSLPGFDLPTGQNGLFRMSGDGSTTPTQSTGLTQVRGLPDRSFQANPQKYLIETNPALTDMRRFMSSDYLLTNLGYDPDTAAKRLGDGFYEQRLIQQAVIARTGQRFLDGQNSDDGMFKYLMNNAIASKDSLNLSLGVSLTAEQVAALTHDIVWMENRTVNNQQVLVPVLYLAQANNRLAPNGALIQGSDVSLIAGKNLNNAGTLRASSNLRATAGDSLVNSGLMEAGGRLDALASNNLTNRAGGVIAGRDVSVVALTGDVTNERTVTTHESDSGYRSERTDFIDSAARIEAGNNLTISAGRDINSVGGVLKSGADTTLNATRDVNLIAAERITSGTRGRHRDQDIKQYGSSLDSGRDLTVNAGRNLTVVGTQIDAKRDVAMAAQGNLTFASAADEQHSYSKSKKVTRQEDHVSQVASTVNAGRNVVMSAGQDLAMIASKVNAANQAYFVAGGKLELLAAQNRDYSLYDMKKKGGWGSLKMRRDEVTQITHIGSQIQTGGDLTLRSGGDQRYQVAKLQSGKDLILESGGAIVFEGVKDLHDESHTKTNNNAFWNSAKGKGNTDETLRQTQMAAAGNITIKAVEGLKIDIKHVDQKTVSQTIDAMVKADPQLAWIKEAEQRGDVDWRQVKEIHESFKYNTSGLGPASQLIIAIALAAVMGPMMAGMNTMLQAGALSVATKATVSTIDNRGNLGAIAKDVTSKDSLKGYAVSMATAGVTQGLGYEAGNVGFNAESAKTVAMKVAADAAIKTAVYGGSFKDNFANSLVGTAASIGGAYGAGKIGDLPLTEGSLEKVLLHSALGGLMAEVMGGDFRTGAIAGGANEVLIGLLGDTLLPSHLEPGTAEYIRAQENLVALSKVVGVLGAAASNGDLEVAAQVAENGTRYNFLGDHSKAERDRVLKEYEETKSLDAAQKMMVLQGSDQRSDALLARFHTDPASLSPSEKTELGAYLQVFGYEQSKEHGVEAARTSINNLLENGPDPYRDYPYAGGTTQERIAYADGLRAQDGVSVANIFWSRDQSASEMLYRDAQGYLRINGEMQAMSDVGSPALYFLTGNLGTTIRVAAAANGVLQAGHGAGQVYDGDTWNGIGNIVVGAMNAASLGIPKVGFSGRGSTSIGAKDTVSAVDDFTNVPKASGDPVVVRSDNDFSLPVGINGKPKAYITEDGDLVPPNLEGTGSIQTHVRGGGSENSPYISVTDPSVSLSPKDYGTQKIEIDVKRLREDIDSGVLPDTKFLSNREVAAELQARVNAARDKYTNNPSPKNETSLSRAEADLVNVMRDGECLIKGCVPAGYIKFIQK